MKRLTLTTIVVLDDSEEDHLYKYIQSNGFPETFNSELKNTGMAMKKENAGTISIMTVAQVDHIDSATKE